MTDINGMIEAMREAESECALMTDTLSEYDGKVLKATALAALRWLADHENMPDEMVRAWLDGHNREVGMTFSWNVRNGMKYALNVRIKELEARL